MIFWYFKDYTKGENSARARCDYAANLKALDCKKIMDVQPQYNVWYFLWIIFIYF